MGLTVNGIRGLRAWRRGLPPRRLPGHRAGAGTAGRDAGASDAPGSTDQVVARLDPASRAREGQRLQLWFDPGKLHLFNPDNGAHLTL